MTTTTIRPTFGGKSYPSSNGYYPPAHKMPPSVSSSSSSSSLSLFVPTSNPIKPNGDMSSRYDDDESEEDNDDDNHSQPQDEDDKYDDNHHDDHEDQDNPHTPTLVQHDPEDNQGNPEEPNMYSRDVMAFLKTWAHKSEDGYAKRTKPPPFPTVRVGWLRYHNNKGVMRCQFKRCGYQLMWFNGQTKAPPIVLNRNIPIEQFKTPDTTVRSVCDRCKKFYKEQILPAYIKERLELVDKGDPRIIAPILPNIKEVSRKGQGKRKGSKETKGPSSRNPKRPRLPSPSQSEPDDDTSDTDSDTDTDSSTDSSQQDPEDRKEEEENENAMLIQLWGQKHEKILKDILGRLDKIDERLRKKREKKDNKHKRRKTSMSSLMEF
jgi:hypothetical protein